MRLAQGEKAERPRSKADFADTDNATTARVQRKRMRLQLCHPHTCLPCAPLASPNLPRLQICLPCATPCTHGRRDSCHVLCTLAKRRHALKAHPVRLRPRPKARTQAHQCLLGALHRHPLISGSVLLHAKQRILSRLTPVAYNLDPVTYNLAPELIAPRRIDASWALSTATSLTRRRQLHRRSSWAS